MKNLQEIQEKIFFEAKTILETLSKISSADELVGKQDLFEEVTDRIAFLRILEKNEDFFINKPLLQRTDQEEARLNFEGKPIAASDDESAQEIVEKDAVEEEVLFNNELNEITEEEHGEQPVSTIHNDPQNHLKEEVIQISQTMDTTPEPIAESEETENDNYQSTIEQKERAFRELEERRRRIVEFSKEEVVHPSKEQVTEQPRDQPGDKKFKLAHIKGLKAVQHLFDEDPLSEIVEEDRKSDAGGLLKTNISTDYMEAEKRKPDFKIDLNDRVAFTKVLFNGDQDGLKAAVDKLNSFKDLEGARQYLSEIYYQKNWRKNDEIAQRLWNLVENKFL